MKWFFTTFSLTISPAIQVLLYKNNDAFKPRRETLKKVRWCLRKLKQLRVSVPGDYAGVSERCCWWCCRWEWNSIDETKIAKQSQFKTIKTGEPKRQQKNWVKAVISWQGITSTNFSRKKKCPWKCINGPFQQSG